MALPHLVKRRIWFSAQLGAKRRSNALHMRNVINAQNRTLLLHVPSVDLTGGSFESFLHINVFYTLTNTDKFKHSSPQTASFGEL